MCRHRTQWKTLHSFIVFFFFLFSVCSFSETDQCDQCDSVIEEENKKFTIGFLIILIGSLKKEKKIFICQLPPPESEKNKNKNKKYQSLLPLIARYGEKLDAGVSDLHTASTSVTGEFLRRKL